MKWHADIQSVDNGFLVIYGDSTETHRVAYGEKNEFAKEPDKSHIVEMFYDILDHFGEQGSKHDKKRIRIAWEE